MIHETLHMQLTLFQMTYHRDPEYVYLGHQEWHELLATHRGTMRRNHETGDEYFAGIKIIRVNEENHLNIT